MKNHPKDHESSKSIQQTVLEKIRAGEVQRRPRWQFMLRIVATIVVSIVLLLSSALVISFILFSIQESGEQFLLSFGFHGIEVFLLLFPWLPTIFSIALFFVLQWLLQGFRFAYRVPLLNIFLGIVGVSIVFGFVINFTPLHLTLLGFADKDELPILGEPYEHIFDSHHHDGECMGMVISVSTSANGNSFVVSHNDRDHDSDDGNFIVRIPPGSGLTLPAVGQNVLVFGYPQPDGSINAEHIQPIPPPPPDPDHDQ